MQKDPENSKRYAYYVFGLLFLLYMFDYIDRLVVVSLFPYIKEDWGLTDAQCGMFVSTVYWSILILSLPASILVDRWSRRKSIGIMSVLWSVAAVSCAFTNNFKQLFIARTAIGVGEAGYAPGGTALISTLFPEKNRARMLGLWNASIPLGSALGIGLGAFIAERYGWRHAFGIIALPGLLVAILFFFIKDYKTIELTRKAVDIGSDQTVKMNVPDIARHFLTNKTLIFNNLAFAASVFLTTAMMTWLPTYFHRVNNVPMTEAGIKGGAVMLLAIVGAPLGGYLADKWYVRRKTARLIFPALTSFSSAIFLFIAFTFFKGNLQFTILILNGILIVGFVPAAVAVTQDVVHPGLRAVSLSLNVIIQHILGSSTAPIVIGALSDAYGIETAMIFLPIAPVIAGTLYLIASRFYLADLNRVQNEISHLAN
ncbi:MFS transporter [bacterium]|nr:MFS transporter [bacterium]